MSRGSNKSYKRKRKRRKLEKRAKAVVKGDPSLDEVSLIGDPCLFVTQHASSAPKVFGWVPVAAYYRKGKAQSRFMEQIGNIQDAWHGTKLYSLNSITRKGLVVGGKFCMFGAGIYTAPHIRKAVVYAGGMGSFYQYKALLKCRVALGNMYIAERTGDHKGYLQAHNFDSLKGDAGALSGSWGGSLQNSEYVVYDARQVTVVEIFIYKDTNQRRNYTYPRPVKLVAPSVSNHPCNREAKVCVNAYGTSGCIKLSRKSGCSNEDREWCRHFEV